MDLIFSDPHPTKKVFTPAAQPSPHSYISTKPPKTYASVAKKAKQLNQPPDKPIKLRTYAENKKFFKDNVKPIPKASSRKAADFYKHISKTPKKPKRKARTAPSPCPSPPPQPRPQDSKRFSRTLDVPYNPPKNELSLEDRITLGFTLKEKDLKEHIAQRELTPTPPPLAQHIWKPIVHKIPKFSENQTILFTFYSNWFHYLANKT